MTFDIVLVLYNSEKWLPMCLQALGRVRYAKECLHVWAVDNASAKDPQPVWDACAEHLAGFGQARLVRSAKNEGFGAACNRGAALGNSENLFFLNVDTEVDAGVFEALEVAITAAAPTVAAFECRQLPYETGHHIDPVSLQTSWASAAALVVRREAFGAVGGFDPHFFMYCEDVDLSWHLRACGYTLQYVPAAVVWHYSSIADPAQRDELAEAPDIKLSEYTFGLYGNLMLRYKYGTLGDIARGWALYFRFLHRPRHYPYVRRVLAKNFLRHLLKLWPFLFWRFGHRRAYKAKVARFEGGFSPERGSFALLRRPMGGALVSVVVRTCGRPEVLRRTLRALRHQTYPNFEVVVVEDGPEASSAVVEEELAGIPHLYHVNGQNLGRGKAGNVGLSLAKGAYLNFLDDDDFFYPDHIELLVAQLEENPDADFVTAASMAMEADVKSRDPYVVEVKALYPMRYERMDNFLICQSCLMPIQSVLFKRELFERYGGLNEAVDGDEDWSMWMKYFAYGKKINDRRVDVDRATSIFLVPADGDAAQKREAYYRQYEDEVLDDESIRFTVTPRQMRTYYENLIGDLLHLQNTGQLEAYIDKWARHFKLK